MYSTLPPGARNDNRAASAIVGLVLLFGLVIAGAGIIFWAGMDAKQSVQSASEVDTAETSLQEVSSKLSTLSFKGNGTVTSFDLSGKEPNEVAIEEQGRIRFQINRNSSCTHEMQLGSIVYENDDGTTVAYQAGGVFKKRGSSVTVVQSPTLEYRSQQVNNETVQTIRFPVVNVTGDIDGGDEVTARASQKRNDKLEEDLCLAGGSGSVAHVDNLTVTVEDSPYYSGWVRYFDSEFGEEHVIANNSDPSTRTASYVVELGRNDSTTSSPGPETNEYTVPGATVRAAIWSSQNELKFQSSSGAHRTTLVDSYDSSENPYTVESGSEGVVVNDGQIRIKQNTEIYGDVFADGDVRLQGSGSEPVYVEGNVVYNGSRSGNHYTVTGQFKRGFGFVPDGVVSPDSDIQNAIANAQDPDVNNNTETNVFKTGRGEVHAGTVTHGIYYTQDFAFDVDDDEKVVFDTSDGDIVVVVDGPIDSESRMEVRGDGQVRFFVKGDVALDNKVKVYDEGASSPNNDSTRVRMYVHSGHDVAFEEQTEFTGIVYTPTGSDVALKQGSPSEAAEVYGAVVGGKVIVNKGAQVHYDLAAKDSEPKSTNESSMPAPDEDDDGVPDAVDECENSDGSGVNGCGPVTEDEDANALVVNQSTARLTVVGSMVADNKTYIREVGEREPLDVVFVIDDSGSMGNPEINQISSYDYPVTGTPDSWTPWETPEEASYVDEDAHRFGWDYVPSGQQWEVRYKYPGWMYPDQEILNPGSRGDFQADGGPGNDPDPITEVRRRNTTTSERTYTVDPGEVWLVSKEPEPAEWELGPGDGVETQWFRAGESFSSENWNYYERYELGNDPDDQREGAMQTFIGMLNASNGDRVGVVSFTTSNAGNTDVMWDLSWRGDEFDNANTSLNLQSEGGTPMQDAIQRGSTELQSGSNDKKVMVLLTDGRPDGAEWRVIDAAEDVPDDIQIQTIGLGGNTDEDLLREIADETDGDYSSVGDSDGLNETFREIAGAVTEEKVNVIEYKNTTVEVEVGTSSVTLSGNANDPTDDTRPSKEIDIASLQGASDDEIEEYVGTLVSARATTQSCNGNSTFDTTTGPDGETYEEVVCNATSGVFDDVGNAYDATHKIYVDGESVPSSSEFDGGWFKDQTFTQVIEEYETDTGKTLLDSSGNAFDLGENDAVIVVKTNSSNDDTDYVVLHFEAYDTTVEYDVDAPVSDNPADDPDPAPSNPSTNNSYVVEINENNVEVGNESSSSVTAAAIQPGSAPRAFTAVDPGPTRGSQPAARVADAAQ